jgi:hypothetical protein
MVVGVETHQNRANAQKSRVNQHPSRLTRMKGSAPGRSTCRATHSANARPSMNPTPSRKWTKHASAGARSSWSTRASSVAPDRGRAHRSSQRPTAMGKTPSSNARRTASLAREQTRVAEERVHRPTEAATWFRYGRLKLVWFSQVGRLVFGSRDTHASPIIPPQTHLQQPARPTPRVRVVQPPQPHGHITPQGDGARPGQDAVAEAQGHEVPGGGELHLG